MIDGLIGKQKGVIIQEEVTYKPSDNYLKEQVKKFELEAQAEKEKAKTAREQANAMQITITNLINEKMGREHKIAELNAQCALMRDIIQEALSK